MVRLVVLSRPIFAGPVMIHGVTGWFQNLTILALNQGPFVGQP